VYAARSPTQLLEHAQTLLTCDPEYPIFWHHVLGPKADALTWLGDTDGALDTVEECMASFRRIGRPLAMASLVMCAYGLAALADSTARPGTSRVATEAAARARARGEALLAHAEEVAAHGPTRLNTIGPEGRAWHLRVRAEATRLAGASDVEAWRAAHGAFDGYGHAYESARSGWRLAEAFLAVGDGRADRDEAVALLRDGRQVADRLGARPLRDAIDVLARRHRLDVGAGVATQSVLTPREEEVMRLVAAGLTNREIGAQLYISEKTASVHVSNVLGKLGASGRAEAVAVAHRRGLLGTVAAGES
jgi:DNA-binding CsgD family transcriptional regulator